MMYAIVGPTATGKTALSLALAEALGGPENVEIVSADAMQLYRGMDIGTAKIAPQERRGITHHQLDVLDVREEASVAAYQKHARTNVEDILARKKTPIIVGGSGLYVAALLDELDFPGRFPDIRAELECELAERGRGVLRAELEEKDPQAAAAIAPENERRLIRALEVIRGTGGLFTARFPRHTSHYSGVVACACDMDSDLLKQRIEDRTAHMFAAGLVEETRGLLAHGLEEGRTARTATGYAQAISVLAGTMSEAEAIESVSQATRKLVKKQRTWFRADQRLTWIDMSEGNMERAVRAVLACRPAS